MSDIKLVSVAKDFGTSKIIKGVSFEVEQGEFIVFVGPSGCGKSTLLRLIAGLEDITRGELWMQDQLMNDVPPVKRNVAMVFQSYALYPHMNVYENMAFGLRNLKVSEDDIKRRVTEAAATLQITHLLEYRPKELSGGQRQRVAIGRTIVRKPNIFLFDEPLSNLDAALRVQMRIEMSKLHQKLKTTMIYVTHDQVEAMTLADRIVVINQGQVEQIGAPLELYERPSNIFVAGFIGSPAMNFIQCRITKLSNRSITLDIQGQQQIAFPLPHNLRNEATKIKVGDTLTLGVRPEAVAVKHPIDNQIALTGELVTIEALGNTSYGYVQINKDTMVTCHIKGFKGAQRKVNLAIQPADCYFFNRHGKSLV